MDNIRLTKQMHLNFIESEIMNYNYHKVMRRKYQEMIDLLNQEYNYLLHNPPIGGSIIKMPSGSYNNSNWQLEFKGKIGKFEEKRNLEDLYIKRVDKWLSEISFDSKHLEVVELFMKQGFDAVVVADEVGYAEKNIYRIKDSVLNKIYLRYFQ